MPISNPYGAVQGALEQTRLSMKDVLEGYLTQKEIENEYALENQRAEVALAEQANRQAAAKNAYELSLREQALREQNAQDEAAYRNAVRAEESRRTSLTAEHQRAIEETARMNAETQRKAAESNIRVDNARIGEINTRLAQFKNDTKVDTVANHAQRQGVPSWFISKYVGLDPETKLPGQAVANLGEAYIKMIQKDGEGAGLMGTFYKDKEVYDKAWEVLSDPKTTDAEREPYRKQLAVIVPRMRQVKEQLENRPVNQHDLVAAMKVWADILGPGATPEAIESRAAASLKQGSGLPKIQESTPYKGSLAEEAKKQASAKGSRSKGAWMAAAKVKNPKESEEVLSAYYDRVYGGK